MKTVKCAVITGAFCAGLAFPMYTALANHDDRPGLHKGWEKKHHGWANKHDKKWQRDYRERHTGALRDAQNSHSDVRAVMPGRKSQPGESIIDPRDARQNVKEARKQLRREVEELKRDRTELRKDLRKGASREEILADRREIRQQVKNVAASKKQLEQSREELKEARRELRQDLGLK